MARTRKTPANGDSTKYETNKKKPSASKNANSASAKLAQITADVKFNLEDVHLSRVGPYTGVALRGGIARGETGDPALPWKSVYLSVPPNCLIKDIKIKATKSKTLGKGMLIEPLQPNIPTIVGERVQWIDADRTHYNAHPFWPSNNIEATARIRRMSDFAIADVELCPFRYDAGKRSLEFVQQMQVTINYTLKGQIETKKMTPYHARLEEKYARRVAAKVLNPDQVTEFLPKPEFDGWLEPIIFPIYDYVIVTSQALASTFQRLAHWRTIMGLRTCVVTTEDIVANSVPNTGSAVFNHSSGYSDGGTRDLAEAVRNFLKWAVEHWSIDYVLLGGDTEVIPCRYALHTAAGTVSYRNLTESLIYHGQLLYALNASTQISSSPASNAGDDDPVSVWECESTDLNPWIGGYLGVNRPINRVDLTWGPNHATGYVVEISDDNATWTQIYSETSGSGATETLTLTPTTATYLRLRITSGSNFSLGTVAVYGPHHTDYGGCAYNFGTTTTRVYLRVNMLANPTINDPQLIIKEGPHAGTLIPYNETCSASNLGWRFIERLTDTTSTVSTTPTNFVEIRGPAAYHGSAFALKSELNYIPTDLYYSDLLVSEYPSASEHDWDADGNQIYGERYGGDLDGVNAIPDVYTGRASVETVEEASSFIDKIIAYERYEAEDEFGVSFTKPFDVATSVLLGSQDWAHSNTVGMLDGSARGKEEIRASLRAIDPSRFHFTRRYQDYSDIPPADQGSDVGEFSKAEIIAGIEANNHVISLSSHGSSGYLCGLVSSDVDALENYPGLIYGNACSTNKFDVSSGEALGEHAILNSKGAGVAYVGNSRFGWTGDNPMELAFWETWASGDRLGEAYNAAKNPSFGGWQAYSLNLNGDPGMRGWNNTPQQIEVSHLDEVCAGTSNFQVHVTHGGVAVAGAQVCLTINDSFFRVAETDSSGVANLAIASSATGTMRVTVSGHNLLPYFGSVDVIKCGGGCHLLISCGKLVACGKAIACSHMLSCSRLINCGRAIVGGMGCGKAIDMCPTIRPPDWWLVDYFKDHWALNNLSDLAKRVDEPEVKKVLDDTPEELRKPLMAMLERIRREK